MIDSSLFLTSLLLFMQFVELYPSHNMKYLEPYNFSLFNLWHQFKHFLVLISITIPEMQGNNSLQDWYSLR